MLRSRSAARRDVASLSREEVLRRLIRDHADAIYRVAVSVVRDPHLAEDITQDTVIKAWRNLDSWNGEGSLKSWVLSIAHNTSVSYLRRMREESRSPDTMPDGPSGDDVERSAEGRSDLSDLAAALDNLDKLSRAVVTLRDVEGMSYAEIAESLGVSVPTVKTRLLRARRELQRSLKREVPT
jgi:RNA polymerase sigma-70 factor (ECF subfamily)